MHCLPRLRLGLSADGASMTRRPHPCYTLRQKEDERKKEVPAKVLEVRRQPSASPAPRERARGVRGGERLSGRGARVPPHFLFRGH